MILEYRNKRKAERYIHITKEVEKSQKNCLSHIQVDCKSDLLLQTVKDTNIYSKLNLNE